MWVPSIVRASRVTLRRNFSLLTAPFVLAILLSIFIAPTSYAADAIWQGTSLSYQENTYQKTTAPPNRDNTPNEYEWRDTSANPDKASVFYFGDNPGDAKSATLVTYDIEAGDYKNPSSAQTVSVTRDLLVSDEGSASSCTTSGIGWIVCPVANFIAGGVDMVYGLVESFLEVQTIRDNQNGVYQLWQVFRTIANVCFILVFLAIIYSQLTGAGFSNYNLKTMMPRLVLGAILVNISFFICALAVDASNILGYSIQAIFVSIRESLPVNGDLTSDGITWENLSGMILGGGAVGASVLGLTAATALSAASMSYLLIAALIPVGLAVLVAFIILAARQALIVVLTILAPLAFVAFILPGTSNWFDKWRKGFMVLLIFFPAFAMLFGGSQLAGTAIINTTPSVQDNLKIPMVLIGLTTMVVPLVITPFLIRFSSGILGQIANIANNKSRGLSDRAKNWAYDKSDMHRLNKLANNTERRDKRLQDLQTKINNGEQIGGFQQRWNRRNSLANHMDKKKRDRDMYKKQSEALLANEHSAEWQRKLNEPEAPSRAESAFGRRSLAQRTSDKEHLSHRLQHQADGEKAAHEAHSNLSWQRHLDTDLGARDRSLYVKAYGEQQQSDSYKTILESGTKSNWERTSVEDSALQGLRLKAASQSDDAKLAEQEYNLLIENIRAKGTDGTAINARSATTAQEMQEIFRRSQEMGSAQEVAKSIQQVDFAKSIENNAADLARATGIGNESDSARVLARAKSTVSSAFINDAKNIQSTMDYDLATNPERLSADFKASSDMPMAKRLATIWASATNGNFGYESAREMIDWYSQHGGANGGRPNENDLRDFKELIKVDPAIGGGDRALELYLNDGNNSKSLDEWMHNMGTWNIKTSRFVEMGETRQREAIKFWKSTSDPKGMQMFNRVRSDISRTPTLNSALKDAVKADLGLSVDPEVESL